MRHFLLLSTTVLLSTSFANGAMALDTLKLRNGDVLSGTISDYSPAGITIQTDYGVFDVPISKIGGVESPNFSMADLSTHNDLNPDTTLGPVSENLIPLPEAQPQTEIVEQADNTSTEEALTDDTGLWGAKWSGEINAGGELETGNSDSKSVTLDGKTKANWDDIHRLTLGADYDWEEENDVQVSDERQAYTAYDYFFGEDWFWNNRASFEQDDIEDLDYRITATSGLGYQVYNEDDLSLEVTLGPGYEREEYDGEEADDSVTTNWSLDYEQSFYDDFFRSYHNHTLTSPMDDFTSYLFESETGIKIPLKNGITASGEIEFDWNEDPAIGEQEDDTTYALKLGYEW